MPLVPVLPILQDRFAEYERLLWLKRAPEQCVAVAKQIERTLEAMSQRQAVPAGVVRNLLLGLPGLVQSLKDLPTLRTRRGQRKKVLPVYPGPSGGDMLMYLRL